MTNEPILKSHRRPGVETTVVAVKNVRFGDGSYPVVAGPVAIENEDQIVAVAHAAAESGVSMLRGAAFRAETSPYGFKGLGEEGLWHLEHAGKLSGLPTVSEVLEPGHVDLVADHVDMLEIGPDNMQNFVLVRAAGKVGKPVLLHRGPAATIDEWLMSAEYILAEDNNDVVLCERGSRTFDPRTSDTLDISAIPVVQQMSHLPVVIDPAPTDRTHELIRPLALAGRSVGADGLVVAAHVDPETALAGNGNQLDLSELQHLMEALGIPSMRDEIDRVDRELVKLIARRLHASVEIGRIKAKRDLPMRSLDREAELIGEARDDATAAGIDPDYIEAVFTTVLEYSRAAQQAAIDVDRGLAAGSD